ncbi:hypothetical protein P154DRAFT_527698 [Amniculicola lignicola CBS 123094]|uniref:EthD domain-containing protein n=1 Tax=Amniculicola lignicola CBS 123094 TaxID=1392246 RepID=A0A6A5VX29_9PLEO|nr:hypothetical protein P154DRAFT_527698 [Amniculicola lignicola CBS 123094]
MADTPYTPLKTKDYLPLADKFPANAPITVVHMLQFHEVAKYPPSSPHGSLAPVTGREAFHQRYMPAAAAAAQEVGITPAETRFFFTSVVNLLSHNGDVAWDVVAARRYQSFGEYARYQASEAYTTNAVPHRDAALKNWSLVACLEQDVPTF